MTEIADAARGPDGTRARDVAGQAKEAALSATSDTATTAKEEIKEVAGQVREQAGSVATDLREKLGEQLRGQNDKMVDGLRRISDELGGMASEGESSPARDMVSRVARSGRQLADHLAERGPDGVLADIEDFARRRPGTFLAAALVTGFVIGRVGRGVLAASDGGTTGTGRDTTSMPVTAHPVEPIVPAQAVQPVLEPEPVAAGWAETGRR